ncbi:hypothetical protein CcaverHIS002_0112220 [Cutaneotrichosporon cavernicola]|uniref:Association with the SNF1 complex (ASC) domain-containing protein n=1 Tax=Cutaneotrichosporon cavernicola TaxID=279322 RepID=A0AA48L185_9TREE|nr:uncharacterized protein CcaverHIS019_0112100 [Cutaneotrichosporon cavernicola]BEI80693.1 hypothetical protein CcaverHIS002_0112220 [Cutaneotrichosporon cavernicola]BEI88492.1 hypothetical protein CcaverHIS019_0112100 [Cutaneotrichosporon cavernicola]BEI96265.1 hypothetical protein CcaverHIS631_0112140 [Cutaneotrichosporon cavernicola]BEJ04037.1 hypothetical protein CcaverHIS641_0112120 [Cutaneotrichosporon cavernicola]
MPQRSQQQGQQGQPAAHGVSSPLSENSITSPSQQKPGSASPRRRKSLELPDLNKLSFTPASPQPTTATQTANASASNAPANSSLPSNSASGGSTSSPGASASPHQQQGSAGPAVDSGNLMPPSSGSVIPGVTVVPVNDSSTHVPSRPIPIRSPRAIAAELPHDRAHRPRPQVNLVDSPHRTGLTPPPPTAAATPAPPVSAAGTDDAKAKRDGLVDVPIQWNGGGRNVYVTGNFADNWRGRVKLKKSTHDFNTVLRLAPGQYRLKFIVDDSWRCSKAIPAATDDDGTLVNWIEVDAPKTEEELAAEWAMDAKPATKAEDVDPHQWTSELPTALVLYQYLEELPQMYSNDVLRQFVSTAPYFAPVPKPPQLPRILEKVILNSEPRRPLEPVPANASGPQAEAVDDNAILPTPSHVVLNHLMASAQKNGTLGVATTSRYHKKYVSTLLFKSSSPPSDDKQSLPSPQERAAALAAAANAASS